mgnify:CR=1 FL=1
MVVGHHRKRAGYRSAHRRVERVERRLNVLVVRSRICILSNEVWNRAELRIATDVLRGITRNQIERVADSQRRRRIRRARAPAQHVHHRVSDEFCVVGLRQGMVHTLAAPAAPQSGVVPRRKVRGIDQALRRPGRTAIADCQCGASYMNLPGISSRSALVQSSGGCCACPSSPGSRTPRRHREPQRTP